MHICTILSDSPYHSRLTGSFFTTFWATIDEDSPELCLSFPAQPSSVSSTATPTAQPCFRCGLTGHFVAECPTSPGAHTPAAYSYRPFVAPSQRPDSFRPRWPSTAHFFALPATPQQSACAFSNTGSYHRVRCPYPHICSSCGGQQSCPAIIRELHVHLLSTSIVTPVVVPLLSVLLRHHPDVALSPFLLSGFTHGF